MNAEQIGYWKNLIRHWDVANRPRRLAIDVVAEILMDEEFLALDIHDQFLVGLLIQSMIRS